MVDMGQYDSNMPGDTAPAAAPEDTISRMIEQLEKRILRQERLIEDLQRDIRRLKGKLSRHADTINGMSNG